MRRGIIRNHPEWQHDRIHCHLVRYRSFFSSASSAIVSLRFQVSVFDLNQTWRRTSSTLIKTDQPKKEWGLQGKSLDQYLSICKSDDETLSLSRPIDPIIAVSDYPERAVRAAKPKVQDDDSDEDDDDNKGRKQAQDDRPQMQPFRIRNAGDCTSNSSYGYNNGKPCVLVKMNKVKCRSIRSRSGSLTLTFAIRLSVSNLNPVRQPTTKPITRRADVSTKMVQVPFIAPEK